MNSSPLNNQTPFPPYVEPNYNISYLLSIIESFFLTLFAELGDKTFVMLIILQLKTNKVTIFYSALLAELLMNISAIFIGYFIDCLLYKNLIDYFGIMFYIIYGFFLLGNTRKDEDMEVYENELLLVEEINENMGNYDIGDKEYQLLLENSVHHNGIEKQEDTSSLEDQKNYEIQKIKAMSRKAPLKEELDIIPESDDISREDTFNYESIKNKNLEKKTPSKNIDEILKKETTISNTDENEENETNNNIDENNFNEALLKKVKKEIKGENIDFSVFWTIFSTVALAEFGDRTQMFSLSMSSIYNLTGVLIGSCCALICSCILGVYYGNKILKKIKVSVFDFILGLLLLTYGIQIFVSKKMAGQ